MIAGTGNRGNIYRLDSDQSYTRLLNLEAAQVTGFAAGANGRLYAVTGNIGEIFAIGPELESSGTLESDVLDAGAFSYWGRMTSLHTGSGAVAFETRSGNVGRAQKDWSPWAKLSGDRVASPAARFLQYRATVSSASRVVRRNRRLRDEERSAVDRRPGEHPCKLQVPGAGGFRRSCRPRARFDAAAAGPHDSSTRVPARGSDTLALSPALTYAKGFIGARWLASDENGDTLRFKIEIRGEHETAWKPLHENLQEHYYSWDSTAYPEWQVPRAGDR